MNDGTFMYDVYVWYLSGFSMKYFHTSVMYMFEIFLSENGESPTETCWTQESRQWYISTFNKVPIRLVPYKRKSNLNM